jgi:hypothetical protein
MESISICLTTKLIMMSRGQIKYRCRCLFVIVSPERSYYLQVSVGPAEKTNTSSQLQTRSSLAKNANHLSLSASVGTRFTLLQTTGGPTLPVRPFIYVGTKLLACKFIMPHNSFRGRNPPENNPMGACQEGYQGIVCADCKIGYSRTGSIYECTACPELAQNIIRLIGLFFFLIIGVTFLVRNNL